MHRIHWIILVIALLSRGTTPNHARHFDREVQSLDLSSDGVYRIGAMYWYSVSVFPHDFHSLPEFIALGEVEEVSAPDPDQQHPLRRAVIEGRLRVDRVLLCPDRLAEQASKIRYIESDAFEGLEPGDRVLVPLLRYQGQYAIPNWDSANSGMGFRLYRWTPEDENLLADLLSTGRMWTPADLSAVELRLWARLDPTGVAEWAIDALEENGLLSP